jgi:hypothetical protein
MAEFGAQFEETEKEYLREFRAAVASDKATREDALFERAHEARRSAADAAFVEDDADGGDNVDRGPTGARVQETAVEHVTAAHVRLVRQHFERFVIRRDHRSQDWLGNPVHALPEKMDIYLRVSMLPREVALYEAANRKYGGKASTDFVDMTESKASTVREIAMLAFAPPGTER